MERIKYWRNKAAGFSLTLWDTGRVDSDGRTVLKYRFRDKGRVVFEGTGFRPSRMHADDSIATVRALLGFLSLKPGDTDKEYFAEYTPEQLEWAESGRAEELQMVNWNKE